jgi:GDPmannose 4,6-dehydratase
MARRALIIGVTGQDGAYLARLLLDRGYEVHGTSRDSVALQHLGFAIGCSFPRYRRSTFDLSPARSSGWSRTRSTTFPASLQSRCRSNSWPRRSKASLWARSICWRCCASPAPGRGSRSVSAIPGPVQPTRRRHSVRRARTAWPRRRPFRSSLTTARRTDCSRARVLFNHESPLRPPRFVTRKITAAAMRIGGGSGERLALGDLSIRRDWGWAPDYVEAMWRMLQLQSPDEFVIASGISHSLEDFVSAAFAGARPRLARARRLRRFAAAAERHCLLAR